MSDFWSECLTRLERDMPAQQFNTWIKALRLANGEARSDRLTLLAPNRWVLNWVRERCLARIETIGNEYFGGPVDIQLAVDDSVEKPAEIPETSEVPEPERPQARASARVRIADPALFGIDRG